MRNIFFSRRSSLFVLLLLWTFLLINNSVFSQQIIKGHITGRDGVALQGATVSVKGTKNISSTNVDGNFVVMASPGNVLEVSFVGYNDYWFNPNLQLNPGY